MLLIDDVLPPVPFTRSQAASAGLDPRRLTTAIANGEVRRVVRSVYVSTSVPDGTLLRAQAAGLAISAHSVLCDRSAAWVLGVDVLTLRELDVVPPLETYVLRGHDPTDRPECNGGTRDLLPCDWFEIGGVRVTTPLRTAMDLGCKLPRRQALGAMDALMRTHGFTGADMTSLLPRYFRRRGVIQLRQLVPRVDPRAESQPESWARCEITDDALPCPELQYWVHVDGVPTYRLDLAYPHARVAVEYDGEEFHSSPADRERDRQRRRWLRDHGWTVIVLTKESLTAEAVDAWIGELRTALTPR